MKHVHAETIIELAQDMSGVVQVRVARQQGDWFDVRGEENSIKWLSGLSDSFESRIKPKPSSKWSPIYQNGVVGPYFGEKPKLIRAHQHAGPHNSLTYILETRDDGTAHLHKVEA